MGLLWKRAGIGFALGLTVLGMSLCLPGVPSQLAYAQTQQAMTPTEWQALARQAASNLDRMGIQMGVAPQVRAVYVPALTQEYLQAFQMALAQGATKQQADVLASQYTFARIQELSAQSSGGGQGGNGCVYSQFGGTVCGGGGGFSGYTPPPGSGGSGVTCGPDGGCIYNR